jgi:hypothetical protein
MNLEEKIIQHVLELPESEKAEVLDFIEYLRAKAGQKERRDWGNFSLSSAMRGMEDEESPYSLGDLSESFQ